MGEPKIYNPELPEQDGRIVHVDEEGVLLTPEEIKEQRKKRAGNMAEEK